MSVTRTGAVRSPRAARVPPNPPPRMTTWGREGAKGAKGARGARGARGAEGDGRSTPLALLAPSAPCLTGDHRARDVDHRLAAVLAGALQNAIGLLLRRPGTAHQYPLRAFDDLAVLELAACLDRILPRLDQVACPPRREPNRRIDDLRRCRLGQKRDGRGRNHVVITQRKRAVARQ